MSLYTIMKHFQAGKIQTVLIPKEDFTLQEALQWLDDHNYARKKVDITEDFYRFRQMTPVKGGRYETKTLPNGVEIVLHYY